MSNTPEGYLVGGDRPDGRGSGTWWRATWDARAMTAVAHAAPGPADPDTVSRTPDDPDLQLARDPRAGAGRLMVLAGNRPDLRGVIADNPGCSPELRAWGAPPPAPDAADPRPQRPGRMALAALTTRMMQCRWHPRAGSPPTSAWVMSPSAPSWVTHSWAHRSSTTTARVTNPPTPIPPSPLVQPLATTRVGAVRRRAGVRPGRTPPPPIPLRPVPPRAQPRPGSRRPPPHPRSGRR